MSRIDQVVRLLETPAGSRILPGRSADDALLELLVHMASMDGTIDEAEIDMLSRVLDGWHRDEVRAYVEGVTGHPLDLDDLASAMETDDQRWNTLRFAARMAHEDDHLDERERAFLTDLAQALALPSDAVARVVHENEIGRTGRIDAARLKELVDAYSWDSADFADGGVQSSDLSPLVPAKAVAVVRIGVDAAEVMGLYDLGVVARFLEGPAFLPWGSIVGTSAGTGLAASVRVHTADGDTFSLVDQRLGGLQMLLDRLHRLPKAPVSADDTPEVIPCATDVDTWGGES